MLVTGPSPVRLAPFFISFKYTKIRKPISAKISWSRSNILLETILATKGSICFLRLIGSTDKALALEVYLATICNLFLATSKGDAFT